MGNHEFCVECGENDFHYDRPCDPVKKAAWQAKQASWAEARKPVEHDGSCRTGLRVVAEYPKITLTCPTCRSTSLFVDDAGKLCCSWIECQNPLAATTALEKSWSLSELRTIGIIYCDVDTDDPEQVEGGLTEGLIYAFLEGSFDRQHAVWEKQFEQQAANARLWRACALLGLLTIILLAVALWVGGRL